MSKILIIPDTHADPEYDNDRFELLGKLVCDELPDIIVCLGDWFDMKSLSSYDKGTTGFEGRRYCLDIEAGNDALARFHAPIKEMNKGLLRRKVAQYKPRMAVTLGNHEDRISRAANSSPALTGTLSLDDLQFADYGWEVYPFKEIVHVEGFAFSHYFSSGVMGRPIGGTSPARSLLQKLHTSAVAGHSHLFDLFVDTRPDGRKILGVVAGAFCHPDFVEGWSKGTAHLWSHGVCILDDAADGFAGDIRYVYRDTLERKYG